MFRLKDYDYELPQELIAQYPPQKRTESRLLVLDRASGRLEHRRFGDIERYFRPGDLLVVNDTRVFPARLIGRKRSGGRVELLLLRLPQSGPVPALFRGKRPRIGLKLIFPEGLEAEITAVGKNGQVEVILKGSGDLLEVLERVGHVPLPPYIRRPDTAEDRFRYQTPFARRPGAVAAPTAGFHFSEELLLRLREKGIIITSITLHVGYGTFAPMKVEDIRDHQIHAEYIEVSPQTARLINLARQERRAIFACGTTTLRALEHAGRSGQLEPMKGWCDLYIYPGFSFKIVDHLITNFHLPRSSLLVLVSAFAGREKVLAAYREAITRRYRFFSYGDAMLIL
ncbi:MAG TPA: tRNA preQ1(34) S-adenosylmethionine ribosyltransferase-isomerase QueA [Thermodesulfatator sp.]|nr:tRNA preQ1(34) S-adenosylmethionine ribosyltransferase-isomerase QueA [Thermodesulfatator sp.]